jgi:tetratricopeptide (TPR) repeat protein
LPESEQRQQLFDAIARAILAPGRPLLLVADDLQWCDRETLQFLHYLLRLAPKARLLVAATARREEIDREHPLNDLLVGLQALERFTEIEVGRLTREETAVLAERLAGHPFEEPHRLYGETEGNPLFVVEALRAGWKGGHAGRGWMSPKVQAVIESRLAQLSEPARDLAGVAATIGREFTSDVLVQASEADEETLVRGLDELWRRRIVREQGTNAYDFSHDRIREVAYLALSPARRRSHHLRVAQALERLYTHEPEPVSGQLAMHYERAGATEQAVTWYVRAAEAAQQLHANIEAVRLLDRALDHLRVLPETPERDTRELAILSVLPALLGRIEGYSSGRLIGVQQRALELARALRVEPPPPLVRSLAIASLSRGDFEAAQKFGEQLHARGERDADDMLLVESKYVLGIAAFWQGEFEAARRHFEAAVDLYRPEHRRAHLLRYGLDPKVICLSRLGNTLWFLGRPEAALALAEEIGHPDSRGTALVFAVLLAVDMRGPERVRAYTASLNDGLDRQWRPTQVSTDAFNGYVAMLDGQKEADIARIQRVLDEAHEADHAPGVRAGLVRLFLEACAVVRDARAGLAAADRALEMGGAARVWEAEARRLCAEFLATLGSPAQDIEPELERALAVARRQGEDVRAQDHSQLPPPSDGARRQFGGERGARPSGRDLRYASRRTGHPGPARGRHTPRPALRRGIPGTFPL